MTAAEGVKMRLSQDGVLIIRVSGGHVLVQDW